MAPIVALAIVVAGGALTWLATRDDGDAGSANAVSYTDPAAVVAALNAAGFECLDAEYFVFEYVSIGVTEAGECFHDTYDVTVVMYPGGGSPPEELLRDLSERIVGGPNWIVGTSELTDLADQIRSAIGGEVIWDNGPVAAAAPEPTTTSRSESTEPEQPGGQLFVEGSAEWAAAGFLSSWQEGDRDAATTYAFDAAPVEEAFDEGFDPDGARLTGCEFVADVINGTYTSYLCEAVLPDAQSIQFYVEGGASAGYHVAHVGLNGNPVGFAPID